MRGDQNANEVAFRSANQLYNTLAVISRYSENLRGYRYTPPRNDTLYIQNGTIASQYNFDSMLFLFYFGGFAVALALLSVLLVILSLHRTRPIDRDTEAQRIHRPERQSLLPRTRLREQPVPLRSDAIHDLEREVIRAQKTP